MKFIKSYRVLHCKIYVLCFIVETPCRIAKKVYLLTFISFKDDRKVKKAKKKEKKEKKRKKKEKKEKKRDKKRRELESQISLAEKIANRERRSRSRERKKKEYRYIILIRGIKSLMT